MLIPLVSLSVLSAVLGLCLSLAGRYFRVEGNPLVEEVAAMMPNSQCGLCGQPSCGTAAERMVNGEVDLTCCVPGGKALAQRIAEKLGVSLSLDGFEEVAPKVASITADACTGCAKCYKACPTDAVSGKSKQAHSVNHELCTGCGKCQEACPNEAVQLAEVPVTLQNWRWQKPALQGAAS